LLLSSTVSLKEELSDQSTASARLDDTLKHIETASIARFTTDRL
jgi:hypothetical protein